jgi:hypothetical protein
MSKLSTHIHECPCCGVKWECGEANYQDECPYPINTRCTNCWSNQTPRKEAECAKAAEPTQANPMSESDHLSK